MHKKNRYERFLDDITAAIITRGADRATIDCEIKNLRAAIEKAESTIKKNKKEL